MNIPRITKNLNLGEIHPDYAGIEFQVCLNPSRRTVRGLTSGDETQFYAAIADMLSIQAEDAQALFEEWPQEVWNALLGGEGQGLIWRWINEHREETLKNSSGGSSEAEGQEVSRQPSGKGSKKRGA